MSFFVDVVSEDSFYENLTLGVTKLLEANPCVKNVQLERRDACDRASLSTWEQKHCCLLTEDLRNFYTSTNGFLLTWSLEIAGEEFPIGRMEIRELSSLKRHVGISNSANSITSSNKEQQANSSTSSCSSSGGGSGSSTSVNPNTNDDTKFPPVIEPTFGGSRCKLFELAECADCRVFLVYQLQLDQDEPSVWLYNAKTGKWYKLADSFCKYFRMMLVHLGLPLWQICAAGLRLPTWVEQVYYLVGPHLIPSINPSISGSKITIEKSLWTDGPTNIVDPAVFRSKEHHHTGARQKVTATSSTNSGAVTSTSTSSSNARKKSSSH